MADSGPAPFTATSSGRRTPAMRRTIRSTSQSPSRHRSGDPLLSRLSPATAVEALKAPSGALKACLDDASPSEQHFAMRIAVASKHIHDWVDELCGWPWPSATPSAGFEMPPTKRRKVSEPRISVGYSSPLSNSRQTVEIEVNYYGSLQASDIYRYERKVDQIHEDLNELDLEEIKSHVLHNHIMPLSRPGTPFSDAGRSSSGSLVSLNKLEDITAVITALTMQTLPNLSKLSRMLKTWSVRIVICRKVPSLLLKISDAEIALRSGWNAIKVDDEVQNFPESGASQQSLGATLSQQDFEIMKSVLQQKVAEPGRDLDFMLDTLEGLPDTLPDEWLDRLEAAEKDYAEWVSRAEQHLREGQWSHLNEPETLTKTASAAGSPGPQIQIQAPSPTRERHRDSDTRDASYLSTLSEQSFAGSVGATSREIVDSDELPEPPGARDIEVLAEEPNRGNARSVDQVANLTKHAVCQLGIDSSAAPAHPAVEDDSLGEEKPFNANDAKPLESKDPMRTFIGCSADLGPQGFDGTADQSKLTKERQSAKSDRILSETDNNILRISPPEVLRPSPDFFHTKNVPDPEGEFSFLESVEEEDESELPPARFTARRDSQDSFASTVIHGPASSIGYSPGPSREISIELELPQLPDPDEPFSSDALSPPSSPPLRYQRRSTSVSFKESPEVSLLPEEDVTPPRSPIEPPEVFDTDTSFDYGRFSSPSRESLVGDGDHLHQQISAVLKSIPNKIRLSTKPTAINLNPPDLQLPTRPKIKTADTFRRSGSAMSTRSNMSSRAGTPSFLLAPAKPPRPQSKLDTKTYYLSRPGNEPPMKLLIRCVGESERVMVRVGGGWADLAEYLKEYAAHHGRRSKGEGKVEVKDLPLGKNIGSSPPSRPGSALDAHPPMTPLAVRKTRKSLGEEGSSRMIPVTPLAQNMESSETPVSATSNGSKGGYDEEGSSILGLSGPHPKKARTLSQESRQWVEDVKTKVRTASSDQRKALDQASMQEAKLGELGKVGGTKRLFRKSTGTPRDHHAQ